MKKLTFILVVAFIATTLFACKSNKEKQLEENKKWAAYYSDSIKAHAFRNYGWNGANAKTKLNIPVDQMKPKCYDIEFYEDFMNVQTQIRKLDI